MKCKTVRSWSTDYLDGDLSAVRTSAVRGHLRTCKDCQAALASEAQLRDALGGLDSEMDPPEQLWGSIQNRLAAEEVADAEHFVRRLTGRWLRERAPLFAGAAVAVAVVVAVVLLGGDGSDDGPRARLDTETSVTPAPVPAPVRTLTVRESLALDRARASARYQRVTDELRALRGERPTVLVVASDATTSAADDMAALDLSSALALQARQRDEVRQLADRVFAEASR